MIKCPNCNSESITVERRPNGYCTCIDCKHRWKNSEVEKPKPLKQILIKTDMTEMPKGCREIEAEKAGSEITYTMRFCDAICYCENKHRDKRAEMFAAVRPEWCPLVEHIVDANKTIDGELISEVTK